ncbi:hypothetical protein MSAN_02515200 [Mycena sanguinolenta]|uniref:Uncharacterized protein n=1 Tax=Mycena sanguinolenta TaxID=230812 RepID=A0A8H6WNS3_9AGAR|nr:hypothetical protein MSAN_02515200 [Mycena sanguinolenta]
MPAFADHAAVAVDLAIFSRIQPRWASNGRDVYPASASASSTPALVVPPPPLPTLPFPCRLTWARAHCPRRRRHRSCRFLADSPRAGLKSTGRVPRTTLRLVDGCARDHRRRRRRLGSACRIGHPVSLHLELTHRAPSSEFMAVGDVWHAACLLVSSRTKVRYYEQMRKE